MKYKLSLRDVAELLLERGFGVTHETIRAWEFRFAPIVTEQLRAKRRGRRSSSWYLDETYVKVAGCWCYLYRAIDRDGNLLDSMLSGHRDRDAARRFLRRLLEVTAHRPRRVTTDRHHAYRQAGEAPHDAVPEQQHGAESSRAEAEVLPDAGVRELRVSLAVLLCVRRAAGLLPRQTARPAKRLAR